MARGSTTRQLSSAKIQIKTLPYFPIGDARYEAAFIPNVSLVPIPSLWGHAAGAGGSPADEKFLNEKISQFLAGGK